MNYMIKELPFETRPRERLKNFGASALSNDELLAILLRTGTKNNNVKSVAQNILKSVDKINDFNNVTLEELSSINGVGEVKAITLLAAVEFGKRVLKEDNNKIKIMDMNTVYDMFKYEFINEKQEKLVAIFLDTKNNLISYKTIFIGTLNGSTVHPREIFKEAVKHSSKSLIILHNHPSGNPSPSLKDEVFTNKMIELGNLMDIPLVDHLIIGNNRYYSFMAHKDKYEKD